MQLRMVLVSALSFAFLPPGGMSQVSNGGGHCQQIDSRDLMSAVRGEAADLPTSSNRELPTCRRDRMAAVITQ
jgi:hypothetical protein